MIVLFVRTKKWLRSMYPVPFRVRVCTLPGDHPKMFGCAGWFIPNDEGVSLIYVAVGIDEVMAETLIEEWSHALRHAMPLTVDYEGEAHDEHFWVTYGRITNAWRKRFFA